MEESKKKTLEDNGWKVSSASEFLGEIQYRPEITKEFLVEVAGFDCGPARAKFTDGIFKGVVLRTRSLASAAAFLTRSEVEYLHKVSGAVLELIKKEDRGDWLLKQ